MQKKKLIFLALTGLLCLSSQAAARAAVLPEVLPQWRSSPRRRPLEKMGADPERVTVDTEAPQYTDNFSIDTEAVTAFAESRSGRSGGKRIWRRWRTWRRIRLYIGFSDGGESVESGDLIALEADPDLLRRAGL